MLYLLVFLVAWSTEIQLNDSIIESYFNQFKISVYLVKEVNEQGVQLSHVDRVWNAIQNYMRQYIS